MKTTKSESNARGFVIGAGVTLALLVLVTFGLWWLTGQVAEQVSTLRTWVVISMLAVPAAAGAGYRLGRIEATGFLSGADKIMNKMTSLVRDVSAIRDTSRITVHQATRPGGPGMQPAPQVWGIVQPQPPRLTYRTADMDDVDNL